jgi:endonuclease III
MRDVVDRLERFYGALPQPPDDAFALYVWEVLGIHTTPSRRDAAMTALRRIPALTPDSMGKVARMKLENAVALAGPYREERLRALNAGVDVFKRHPDLTKALLGDESEAREAVDRLPHLTTVSAQWLLLFAGQKPRLPDDAHLQRVVGRLGTDLEQLAVELGGVLTAVRRTALYLSHHGRATCVAVEPLCRTCPLSDRCPYPKGAAA